jgi:2-(1,2-epoxy-1,2-dihydrophenyl)acetyl-CoA isomerase
MSDYVLTELKEHVLTITLNRPKVNAFNLEMIEAAQAAFKQAGRDSQVRCVLLSGNGSVFSAGQDITEVKKAEDTSFRYHLLHTYNPLVLQIRQLEKPVLAAINGAVSGAALGIALACDLRIAADTPARSFWELDWTRPAVLALPALIGPISFTEYTFSNAPIFADQALLGLVNRAAGSRVICAFEWAASLRLGLYAFGLSKRI